MYKLWWLWLLVILVFWDKILSPFSGLVKFMLKTLRYFRPKISLKIGDGSILTTIDKPPYCDKEFYFFRMHNIQISIASSIFNQMLSIHTVKCQIKDLKNRQILNTDTFGDNDYGGGYLYIFPLEEKNQEVIRTVDPGKKLLCCIPEINLGCLNDGEYKKDERYVLEIKITFTPKGEAFASKKFIIKDNKGEWLNAPSNP